MGKSTAFNPFGVLDKNELELPDDLGNSAKKIFKKDITTKLKGFQEVFEWVECADDIHIFQEDFVKIYMEFSISADRQVREFTQKLLLCLVKKDKSFLKTISKRIASRWLGSLHDPVKGIYEIALASFKFSFTGEKLKSFCDFVLEQVLSDLCSLLDDGIEQIDQKLRSLNAIEENRSFSLSLAVHYHVKSLMTCVSKCSLQESILDKSDNTRLITKLMEIFHSDHYQSFAKLSVIELIDRMDFSESTIDNFLASSLALRDVPVQKKVLSMIKSRLISRKSTTFYHLPLLAFVSTLSTACDQELLSITSDVIGSFFLTAEFVNALEKNFDANVFVEKDKIELLVSMYIQLLSKYPEEECSQAKQRLRQKIISETLPLSILPPVFYVEKLERDWNDETILNDFIEKLKVSAKPVKLLLKLPIEKIVKRSDAESILEISLNSCTVAECAKLAESDNHFISQLILSNVSSQLNSKKLVEFSEYFSARTRNPFQQIIQKHFEKMTLQDKLDILGQLEPKCWAQLFETLDEELLNFLSSESPSMAIDLCLCLATKFHIHENSFIDTLDKKQLTDNDQSKLAKLYVKGKNGTLDLLLNLALDEELDILLITLANNFEKHLDETELACINSIVLSRADGIKIVSKLGSEIKGIMKAGLIKKIGDAFISLPLEITSPIALLVGEDSDSIQKIDEITRGIFAAWLFNSVIRYITTDYFEKACSNSELKMIKIIEDTISKLIDTDPLKELAEMWVKKAEFGSVNFWTSFFAAVVPSAKSIELLSRLRPITLIKQDFINIVDASLSSTDSFELLIFALACTDLKASELLDILPDDLPSGNRIELLRAFSEPFIARKMNIRSDFTSYVIARFKTNFEKETWLDFITTSSLYGYIDVSFWGSNSEFTCDLLDFGLESYSRGSVKDLKNVLDFLSVYKEKHSEFLNPYFEKIFPIFCLSCETPALLKPSRQVLLTTERLCALSRSHMTHELESIDASLLQQLFLHSKHDCVILAIKFLHVLKLDSIVEHAKVAVLKSKIPILFPWTDVVSMFLGSLSTDSFKQLVLIDIMLSYSESTREISELRDLYGSEFSKVSQNILDLITVQLGWNTNNPFDLSKVEFMTFDNDSYSIGDDNSLLIYAASIFSRIIKTFPTTIRSYVETLPKAGANLFTRYFKQYMSPVLTERELSRLRRHAKMNPKDQLGIKVLQTSTNCEVQARYAVEDLSVQLSLTVPDSFPLKPIDVIGGQRLGISETKWRSWILSCQSVFKSDTINILDGLVLWKQNVEKSLEGMEPCPICYCIFHAADKTLPGPSCKTCNNKYHPSCLYKWFKSSGNATCPMCRAVF